jgi:hypothetical protein
MTSKTKTYILAPNFALPPDIIPLGSVIANPLKPERALNKGALAPIPPSEICTRKIASFFVSTARLREKKLGIFASFLAGVLGIGAEVGVSTDANADSVYKIESLETRYFQPGRVFIYEALQSQGVKNFGKMAFWEKPVYMVTGVKVAKGVEMESTDGGGYGVVGKVDVGGAMIGTPGRVGPEGRVTERKWQGVMWKGEEEFVFAYQLIKIKRKKDDSFTEDDYHKGALYDADGLKETKEDESVEMFSKEWDIGEFQDADGGVMGVAEDDEGQDCAIVKY